MHTKAIDSCKVVLFGATGDLALRKLMPALYCLARDGYLSAQVQIIAVSRSTISDEDYAGKVLHWLGKQYAVQAQDEPWQAFKQRLSYIAMDVTCAEQFGPLQQHLKPGLAQQDTVYYLSTASDLYGPICTQLHAQGLVNSRCRVVMEKPIGRDLASFQQINQAVAEIFAESAIYRIDHYLGKETVQNLLAIRFANALFEPVWSNAHIDNVQITVAETVGVEGRWDYYDQFGALRDMVQNHLLQLLCLVAMGVPTSLDADAVRQEKLKVLKSLKCPSVEDVARYTVRAQYVAGSVEGKEVPGYIQESGGRADTDTETFVALRADIHNWRWRGVPFYLRTGKRLPYRYSEIVIQFKPVPHSIFPQHANLASNKLIIRLQPEEGIQLQVMNKRPGLSEQMSLHPVTLNLTLPDHTSKGRLPEAYERLLLDVMRSNSTLFVKREEVEAAWVWIDAILAGWQQSAGEPHGYAAGSGGPQAAVELIARDGRSWHESF